MMKIEITVLAFVLLPVVASAQPTIAFPKAKFKTGDDTAWKKHQFHDSHWPEISTTQRWEQLGYQRYDGFAWYRMKFFLPTSIKTSAYWQDSLMLLLSRIDDVDETFLNGVKIGQTGSFETDAGGYQGRWDVDRIYTIPSNSPFINWDEENLIAVRVFDHSGGGGIFGTAPSVKMMQPQDEIKMALWADENNAHRYHATIENISQKNIEGNWMITVKDEEANQIVKQIIKTASVKARQQFADSITLPQNKRLVITASFKEMHTAEIKTASLITPYILTPTPSLLPRINSASVFGVRQGSSFLFKIAATGQRPLIYKAGNLPAGLMLDESTGIITGQVSGAGDYKLVLSVSNRLGTASQIFTIKAGKQLALTPPMGWNSWNSWAMTVSDEKLKASAQAMIDKGLIDHGWTYINIDDGWQGAERNKEGVLNPNEKFSDIKALGAWLHDKGFKFGIYSSPGTKTCGQAIGSWQHELQDASTYASWGVDYLKYDWCSYEDIFYNNHDSSLAAYKKPYEVMQAALQKQPRDILYSLCQYGMKNVWQWGDEVNGNCWRTTGDIRDTWESVSSIGFSQSPLSAYSKPGNWNDPDMLVVGKVGWSGKLRPTRLTPDEQYSHISLWCLLSAPLLIGCDVSQADEFTISLLSNDEVIAINQDALGKQAIQKIKNNVYEVWLKQLSDGSYAAGLFNRSETYQIINLKFSDVSLKGSYEVMDVWTHKRLGRKENYLVKIPPHGVSLTRLYKK